MKFLVDENVRKEVIEFLKSFGYEVLLPPSGAEDEEIAQIAKQTKSIILTHDQHFANILMYPPQEFSGIIRIKIHPPKAEDITTALHNLLNKLSYEEINKRLIVLEKDGFRIR